MKPADADALARAPFVIPLEPGLPLINANDRLHRQAKARLTKTLRAKAMEAVSEQPALIAALAAARPGPLFRRAHVLGIVHPSRRGRFDPPNWYPSFKACVDGLVDAGLFEDDDHTRVVGPDMRPGRVVKGGQLVLVVQQLALGEQWPSSPAAVS